MKVIGFDPAIVVAGYAVIEAGKILEAGVYRLPRKETVPERLSLLFDHVTETIEDHDPDVAGVEGPFIHPKRFMGQVAMLEARGIMLLACARAGLEIYEPSPSDVKKSMTGSGVASKTQVQQAVVDRCNLKSAPQPLDVSDAIAVSLCVESRIGI
jgi:crossover junction endodeoxyribonuclease RuvC